MIDFTPYIEPIVIALASGALAIIAYAKIAVKNITPEEAEKISIEIITALGDGNFSPKERQDIVTDIIKCMRSK